jgi:hypothetical protein
LVAYKKKVVSFPIEAVERKLPASGACIKSLAPGAMPVACMHYILVDDFQIKSEDVLNLAGAKKGQPCS